MLLSRVHFQFDVIELVKGGSIVENYRLNEITPICNRASLDYTNDQFCEIHLYLYLIT